MVTVLDPPKAQCCTALLVQTVAGHLLITEPQNLVLARQERLDRGYEELEEARRQ